MAYEEWWDDNEEAQAQVFVQRPPPVAQDWNPEFPADVEERQRVLQEGPMGPPPADEAQRAAQAEQERQRSMNNSYGFLRQIGASEGEAMHYASQGVQDGVSPETRYQMDTNARAAGGRLGFPTGPGQPRGWTNALEGQMQQAGVSATEQQLVQAERALQRSMLSPAQQRQMRALENGLETVRRDTDNGTLPRTVGEQSQEMLQIALNRFRHGTVDTPTLQRHVAFLTGMLHAENAAIQLGAAELHHARIANGTLPTGTFINPLDGQRDFWVETAPGHREIQRRPPPQRPAVTPHQLAEHEHTVRMGIHRELAHDVRESAKTLDDEGNPNQPAWVANAVVTNPQRTAAGLPDLPRTLEEATRQEEERLVGEAMARYRALHGETGGGAQGATAGTGGAAAGPSAAAPTTAAPAQTIRQQVVAKHGDEQMLFVVTNLESLIRRYPRGPQTMPIDERAYYRRMRERVETFLSQGSPQQRPAAGPGPALGMGMGLMGN